MAGVFVVGTPSQQPKVPDGLFDTYLPVTVKDTQVSSTGTAYLGFLRQSTWLLAAAGCVLCVVLLVVRLQQCHNTRSDGHVQIPQSENELEKTVQSLPASPGQADDQWL